MIHFRLRRRFRLVVDLLSLNFAGSSNSSSSSHLALRGIHANASSILHPSNVQSLRLPSLSRIVLPRFHSAKLLLRIRRSRYLASSGLLIALSLEVCGCNPAEDTTLPFHSLTDSGALDLTPAGQALSFYDPSGPMGGAGSSRLAFSDPPIDPPPNPIETRPLPWAIPESVYLVYKERRPSESPHSPGLRGAPIATAFVLSVPDRDHQHDKRFLVTARHVVDPQWAHCSQQNPASIDLRLNRRNGGVGYETVPLRSGTVSHFYTPVDATADLAVVPLDQGLIPNLDDYKFLDVPFRFLPTDSEMRLIRADQQIMTAGLSARPSGESGNYPVFDSGFLSKMPAEAIGVRCGAARNPQPPARQLHVWLIDAGVPQGVSGAPVYASIARGPGSAETPVLLGIQSVAWPEKGIAGITPSTILGDLIQSALRDNKLKLDFYRGPNP